MISGNGYCVKNLIHYKKKTVRWQNVEQLKWMHCGSKVTKQSKDQCIKVYSLRVLACIAICFHADNSVWMCVPPRCIKHSTFQNVWRPHHAQPAEYLQIAIYHYFLSYSHLMPVMSRYNFVLKILFVTLFDIVFSSMSCPQACLCPVSCRNQGWIWLTLTLVLYDRTRTFCTVVSVMSSTLRPYLM